MQEEYGRSGALTGLSRLQFDQVVWFVAIAVVLPHQLVELFQVNCVLLGVEEGTADSMLPHTCSDHL